MLLGSRGKCRSTEKADHTSPLITGEMGADGARRVGLRLVWNDYSWGVRKGDAQIFAAARCRRDLQGGNLKASLHLEEGIA